MQKKREWVVVQSSSHLSFPTETSTMLCMIRKEDSEVLSVFMRGTSYLDAKKVIDKIPGMSLGIIEVQMSFVPTGRIQLWD